MFAEAILWSEYLSHSRRWQTYASRCVYLSVVFGGLLVLWPKGRFDYSQLAELGHGLTATLLVLQFCCSLLLTGPHAAGALLQEKEQNTLGLLLISRLSRLEIVLGKLSARTFHVLSYLLYSLPFVIVAVNIGGVSTARLLAAFGLILGVTFLAGAVGTVAGLETDDVLGAATAGYVAIAALVLVPVGHLIGWSAAEGWMVTPGEALWLLTFRGSAIQVPLWHCWLVPLAYCAAAALALTGYAVVRIEHIARRSAGDFAAAGPDRRRGRRLSRLLASDESLDANPVRWREVRTLCAGRLNLIWPVAVLAGCAGSIVLQLAAGHFRWQAALSLPTFDLREAFGFVIIVNYGFAAAAVAGGAVLASLGFIREKRTRSMETLVLTPLTAEQIILGKARGIHRAVATIALWPALVGLSLVPAALYHGEGLWVGPHVLASTALAATFSRYAVFIGLDTSLVENRAARAFAGAMGKVLLSAFLVVLLTSWLVFLALGLASRGSDFGGGDAAALGFLIEAGIVCAFGAVQNRRILRRMGDYFEYYLGIAETTQSGYRPPRDLGDGAFAQPAKRK